MIGDVGIAPRGQQAPADRWTYDWRHGFLAPGEDAPRDEWQAVLPHDFNPLDATRGFHVMRSPPGVQAPPEHINYTPATNEVHDRGAPAPMKYENLTLIPTGNVGRRGLVGTGENGSVASAVGASGDDANGLWTDPYPIPGFPGKLFIKNTATGEVRQIASQTEPQPQTVTPHPFPDGTERVLKPGSDPSVDTNWVVVGRKDDPNKPTNLQLITDSDGRKWWVDPQHPGDVWNPATGQKVSSGPGAQSGSQPSAAASTGPSTKTVWLLSNSPYEMQARQAAEAAGVDPDVYARQIQQESGFEPYEKDGKTPLQNKQGSGAGGIAQFMPGTAADWAKKLNVTLDQFWASPQLQLKAGAMYMKQLLDQNKGDYAAALNQYGGYADSARGNREYSGPILQDATALKNGQIGHQQTVAMAPGTTAAPGTVAANPAGSTGPNFGAPTDKTGTFHIEGGYILNTATGDSRPLPKINEPQVVGNQIVQRNPQTGTFEVVYEAPTNMQLQTVGNALIAFNPRSGTGTVIAKAPGEVQYKDHVFIVPAGTMFHYTDREGKTYDIGSYDDKTGLKVGDQIGFGNPTIDKKTGAVVDGGAKNTPGAAQYDKPNQTVRRPDMSRTSINTSVENDLINSRVGNPQQPTAAQETGRRAYPYTPAAQPAASRPPTPAGGPTPASTPPKAAAIAPPGYTPGATMTEDEYRRKIAAMNGGQDVLGGQDSQPTVHPAVQSIINGDYSGGISASDNDYGPGAWVQGGEYGPPEITPGVSPALPEDYYTLVGGGEDMGPDQWSNPGAVQAAQAPPDGWTPPVPQDQIVGGGNKFGEQTPMEGVHEGTDLQAYQGTPAVSPVNGVVVDVKNEPEGLGLQVAVRDSSGQIHRLSHLSDVAVKVGDEVIAGDQLGSVGDSGAGATGPHLDYRVEDQTGQRMDPEPMMGPLAQLPEHPDTIQRGSPDDVGMGEDPRVQRQYDVGGPNPNAQPEAGIWVGPAFPGGASDAYPTEQELQNFGPSDESNFMRDPWTTDRRSESQFPMEHIAPGQQRFDAEGNYADPRVYPLPLNPYGPMHDPTGVGEDPQPISPFEGLDLSGWDLNDPSARRFLKSMGIDVDKVLEEQRRQQALGEGEDSWDAFFWPRQDFGSPSSMREHLEADAGLRPMTQVGSGEDVYGRTDPDYLAYLRDQLNVQLQQLRQQASSSRYSADTQRRIADQANKVQLQIAQMNHEIQLAQIGIQQQQVGISQQQTNQQGQYYQSLDRYYQGQLTNQGRQLDLTQQDITLRHQDLQDQLKLGYAQLQQQIAAENDQHQVNLANAQTADAQERENERHNQVSEGLSKATLELQAHEDALNRAQQRVMEGTFGQKTQVQLLQSALSNPWTQNLTGMAPGYGTPGWSQNAGGALQGFLKSWNPQPNVIQGIHGDYEALQNDVQSGGAWQPTGGWGFMSQQARPSTENFSSSTSGGQGSVGQQMGGGPVAQDMVTLADGSQMSRAQALAAGYQPWDAKDWGSYQTFRGMGDKATRQAYKKSHNIPTGVTYFGTGDNQVNLGNTMAQGERQLLGAGEDSWVGYGEDDVPVYGRLGDDAYRISDGPDNLAGRLNAAEQQLATTQVQPRTAGRWQTTDPTDWMHYQNAAGEHVAAGAQARTSFGNGLKSDWIYTMVDPAYAQKTMDFLRKGVAQYSAQGNLSPGQQARMAYWAQTADEIQRNLANARGGFVAMATPNFGEFRDRPWNKALYGGQVYQNGGLATDRWNQMAADLPPMDTQTGPGSLDHDANPPNNGGVGGGNIGSNTNNPPPQPAEGGGQGSQAGAGWSGYGLYANPPTDMSFNTWQQLTPYEQASYRTLAESSEPWAQAVQQMRQGWAKEGIFSTPGTSPLSIATWTPEQRMAKENTAEMFGETPQNYWQRQNRGWLNSAASAVSQQT